MATRIGPAAPQTVVTPSKIAEEAPPPAAAAPEAPETVAGWVAKAGRSLSRAAEKTQASVEKATDFVARSDAVIVGTIDKRQAAGGINGLASMVTTPMALVGAGMQLTDVQGREEAKQTLKALAAHPLETAAAVAGQALQSFVENPLRTVGEMSTLLVGGAELKAARAAATARQATKVLDGIKVLSPRAEAQGISVIHNRWLADSKPPLGFKTAETPAAREFAVPVDLDAKGDLVLGRGGQLTPAERDFVERYGAQQPGATPETAFTLGRDALLALIRKKNSGALQESLALVTQHVERGGPAVLSDSARYSEQAAQLSPPTLPEKVAHLTQAEAKTQLLDVKELVAFLNDHGATPISREAVPGHLRPTWDLLARKHDLWAREQISWGNTSNPELVPASQLPANRLALDGAPLIGALQTILAAAPK